MVEEQNIEGVNNVPVNQIGIVSNGYVEKMSLYCLDNMVLSDRNKVFAECCKKVKVGGEIQTRFVNLDLIPKQIRSGDLTSDSILLYCHQYSQFGQKVTSGVATGNGL